MPLGVLEIPWEDLCSSSRPVVERRGVPRRGRRSTVKRTVWIGLVMLVAVAAAVPLWLVLADGGERRTGAISDATCERTFEYEACAELTGQIEVSLASMQALEAEMKRYSDHVREQSELAKTLRQDQYQDLQRSTNTLSTLMKEMSDQLRAMLANVKS